MTHTNQYLNFVSNHPLSKRIGIARTLFDRASNTVKDQDQLHTEQKDMGVYYSAIRPRSSKRPINQDKPQRGYVSVRYIQVISEPFKRLVSSLTDYQVAFKRV